MLSPDILQTKLILAACICDLILSDTTQSNRWGRNVNHQLCLPLFFLYASVELTDYLNISMHLYSKFGFAAWCALFEQHMGGTPAVPEMIRLEIFTLWHHKWSRVGKNLLEMVLRCVHALTFEISHIVRKSVNVYFQPLPRHKGSLQHVLHRMPFLIQPQRGFVSPAEVKPAILCLSCKYNCQKIKKALIGPLQLLYLEQWFTLK